MKARVLLVGQDTPFMENVHRRLASSDFKVRFVQSAGEASAMVQNKDIDVVVLNISDLQADGLQFLRSIEKERNSTEIITLTMASSINWSIRSMKLGVYADLLIPFDNEDLAEKIREACARKKKREKKKKSLLARFGDVMVAATFAEAGEVESAREFLKGANRPKSNLGKGNTKHGKV